MPSAPTEQLRDVVVRMREATGHCWIDPDGQAHVTDPDLPDSFTADQWHYLILQAMGYTDYGQAFKAGYVRAVVAHDWMNIELDRAQPAAVTVASLLVRTHGRDLGQIYLDVHQDWQASRHFTGAAAVREALQYLANGCENVN